MVYRFESFELDLTARELRRAGDAVHVERQVFDVLVLLVSNVGRVVPKSELLDEVWSGSFVSESALTSRIKSARRALDDDGRAQRLIKNVHGVGYRFVGDVAEAAEEATRPTETVPPPVDPDVPSNKAGSREGNFRPDIALTISLDDEFPFVGREEELEALWRLLADDRGRPGVGLVGGEPGVGKSRLVVEIAERAAVELGAVVAAGRCDEQVATPLQPWREVIHQLAASSPVAFERWSTDLPMIQYLLTPARLSTSSPESTDAEPHFDVQIATDSLVLLIDRAASENPVVIVIDDLHWSDEPTRIAMAITQRRLAHRPVYFLASFRTSTDDMREGVAQWLADWERSPRVKRLDIEGLDEEAVRKLALQVLGPQSEMSANGLHARTDGHGLFVTELIRELERGAQGDGLPASIKALVEARLARLDANARTLVVAGAALGPEFAVTHAAAAAELEMSSAIAALDRAIGSGLVHEGGSVERFRFSHQLVPSAVLENLTLPARAALHHRCAEVLEEAGADSTEVAQHILSSVPLTAQAVAVERGRDIANQARRRRHFDEAIRLLERVRFLDLDERVRCEVDLDLAEIMNDAGQGTAAVEIFDTAVEHARDHGWRELFVRAAFGRGGHSPYRRLLDRGTLALLAEIEEFDDLDALTRARVRARTAALQLNWQRYSDREAMSGEALASGRAAGASRHALLEILEARWIAIGCPRGAGLIDAVDVELGALRKELGALAYDAGMRETAALWFARGDVVRYEAAHYLDPAGSRREIDSWRHDGLNGTVASFEGRLDEAAERFDEAGLRGSNCWGDSGPVLHGLAHLFVDAMAGTTRSEPLMADVASRFPTQILSACHAWSLVLCGELKQASEVASRLSPETTPLFAEHLIGGNGLVALAETAIAIERDDLAIAAERELESIEHLVLGLPWAPSFAASHALARLAAYRGDSQAARSRADEAVGAYERLRAPALGAYLEATMGTA